MMKNIPIKYEIVVPVEANIFMVAGAIAATQASIVSLKLILK
jgi:hypothetical protein